MNQNNCALIVSSCDDFSDLWDPFFKLFFKYWPDCPFKVYLVSETKTYSDNRVSMIHSGVGVLWASRLKLAIKHVGTPYFFYLQEDYILKSPVDTKKILELLHVLVANKAAYIRLRPYPPPYKKFKQYKDIGEVKKGSKSSISCQATIHNSTIFEGFLRDGDTGWDTELEGSVRSGIIKEPFLSVYKSVIFYPQATAVKKGIWMYDAIKLCEKEGIQIDKSRRKIESPLHYYLRVTGILPIADRLILWLSPK